jgi:probable addiction module antidote protein
MADYLDSKEMDAAYINAVLEAGNGSEILTAIGHVAKVVGVTKITEETGMS